MTEMPLTNLKPFIALVAEGKALSKQQATEAFSIMMSGEATHAQIGAFLMALRVRGETVEEITGAVEIMREKMTRIDCPEGAIDVCGTGGDGQSTLNISTVVAFICAACGVKVAKHGNRAASSKSGAADVLAALGINIDADITVIRHALFEIGTAFLWAQKYHSAMRHVAAARVEMGTRTLFNLMGPLANPAGVKRQLIGVFSSRWLEPMSRVLMALGCERAWVVHGSDGLDEITTTGKTEICETYRGSIRRFEISPQDYGIQPARLEDIKGGDPSENALAIKALLQGKSGPYRDIVLLNTAAALVIAERVSDIPSGLNLAAKAIDSGKAREVLNNLIRITNEPSMP